VTSSGQSFRHRDIMMQLTSAFILSRLDYCNIILAGLPKLSTSTLQRVQNAAARLVLGLGPRDHIADGLSQLHWLPVKARIRYKLCLLMHMVHTGCVPPYLKDVLLPVSSSSGRSGLQSTITAQHVKRRLRTVFGERAFSFAGPKSWNDLPSLLHTVTATDSFKRSLRLICLISSSLQFNFILVYYEVTFTAPVDI